GPCSTGLCRSGPLRRFHMSTNQLRRTPASDTAPDSAHPFDESSVLVAFKTPMTPRPSTVVLRGDLTLRQSLAELQRVPPKDEAARRLIQQLNRETSGPHDVLVIGPQGELTKIDPERTRLGDIAV